jgi:starch synthase
MRVAFVASEAAPFAKTGGLADVAGSLPRALAEAGVEVTLYLPLYRSARNAGIDITPLEPSSITVPLGPHQVSVGLKGATLPGSSVRVVFLRYDPYFDRDELYGSSGRDYPDNAQRFSLFARAVPVAADALSLSPDVYHLNDWQTALLGA